RVGCATAALSCGLPRKRGLIPPPGRRVSCRGLDSLPVIGAILPFASVGGPGSARAASGPGVSARQRGGAGGPGPPAVGSGPAGGWLVVCCYLRGALLVTKRLWADPAGRMPVSNLSDVDFSAWLKDVDFFAWCMRYSATAVAHGHLPALVTTALNAPRGVNM